MRFVLIAILSVLTLLSCSSERKAQYHYRKALKHGLKVVQDTDTIRITTLDSFPVIINDSIVYEKFIAYRDTVIKFENVFVPTTKFQERLRYKERIKTLKIKGDTEVKIVKHEAKAKAQTKEVVKYRTSWWVVLVAFVLGFFLRLFLNSSLFNRISLLLRYRNQL
jgi:5-formaminoimidazole-4-carboxamide-1-beta-D-ribofuranosyl 5'-monophosphate synthetase